MKTLCLTLLAAFWAITLDAQTNLAAPAPAVAQAPVPASGTNEAAAHSPAEMLILITADSWKGDLKSNVFIYTGNVRINDDPQLVMSCDTFTIEVPKVAAGKFQRGTADGNVVVDFLNDGVTNHATAQKMVYDYFVTNVVTSALTNSVTNKIIVLSGNPVVTNPKMGTTKGEPIIWDLLQGKVTIEHLNQNLLKSGMNTSDLFGQPGQAKTNTPQKKVPDAPGAAK